MLDLDKPGGGDGVSLVNICCKLSPFPILNDSGDLSTELASSSMTLPNLEILCSAVSQNSLKICEKQGF